MTFAVASGLIRPTGGLALLAWLALLALTIALWVIQRRLPAHAAPARAVLKRVVLVLVVLLIVALVAVMVPLGMIKFLKRQAVDLSFGPGSARAQSEASSMRALLG